MQMRLLFLNKGILSIYVPHTFGVSDRVFVNNALQLYRSFKSFNDGYLKTRQFLQT